MDPLLLAPAFLIGALLYASVGHGGASAYLAIMSLAAVAPDEVEELRVLDQTAPAPCLPYITGLDRPVEDVAALAARHPVAADASRATADHDSDRQADVAWVIVVTLDVAEPTFG